MSKNDKMPDIRPEMAAQLWEALGAITYAVEDLNLAEHVNEYHNEELGMGAWEFARRMIDDAAIRDDEELFNELFYETPGGEE